MDEHLYQMELGGAQWHVYVPKELTISNCCEPFMTTSETADCEIRFSVGRPEAPGTLIREQSPRVWQQPDGWTVERTLATEAIANGCICLPRGGLSIRGWLYPDRLERIRTLDHIMDISELEILLSRMDATSLHSSIIRYRGETVLFTAPSGTGKSTQADLWAAQEGADILNGDRSILRRADGRWHAYGSPFAGSSSIYRNEHAPIRAIVVLRQAPENTIRPLSAPEAFRLVYSESVLPRWNTLAHEHVINLISRITTDIPVYLLACTPDARAVELLKKTLWR